MRCYLRLDATKNVLIEGLYELRCQFSLVFAKKVRHWLPDEIVQHGDRLEKSGEPLVGAKVFIRKICGVNMGVPLQSKKLAQFPVLRLKWIDDLFYPKIHRMRWQRARLRECVAAGVEDIRIISWVCIQDWMHLR